MSQQNFYEKYAQLAIDQQIKYGIPASITLQQMALESGHGKSDLAANYNNYFGVKAGSSWKGPTVMKVDDHSYPEAFRVYGSVEESVENHSKVLMASRYRNCFNYSSTDYQNWAIQSGQPVMPQIRPMPRSSSSLSVRTSYTNMTRWHWSRLVSKAWRLDI